MRKFPLLLLLLFAGSCANLRAQAPADADAIRLIDRPHAQDWSSDIVNGWRTQTGDDPAWANPDFDDSDWKTVELDDLGPAQRGWRWFRLHIKLHENHPDLALLIQGGDGTYALYINGKAVSGPTLRSSFRLRRPTERVVPIDEPGTDIVIALRTFTPPAYSAWHLPLFMTAAIGTPDAIENERQSIESGRLYGAIPSIAINLLLMLAGVAVFALHRSQPSHSEYQWLGAYLFLSGLGDLLWISQIYGLFPLSMNFLVADALSYAVTLAQIEFTFSFGGQRVSLPWRVYEFLLICAVPLAWLTWAGLIQGATYLLIEAIIILPMLSLPVLLFLWYRRGNREAGWLILPSLLPPVYISLVDLGSVSIFFGWRSLDFLANPVQISVISLQPGDICALLFLLAIAVVMFFRFTRVSRDQARSAAELAAAREIQQHLVPASLPSLPGYRIETAYLPAQEVGGDFYQILDQPDHSTLIVVGDVSGKGLKAAMTGALAIGALRTLAAENLGPAGLLARLNRQIVKAQDGGFITCLCARIALDGSVRFANAGHLSPYRGGAEIEISSGLPLGLVADVEYSESDLQLAPGETITLLSDGVVEARSADGQLYGFERTRAISSQSAENIAAAAQAFGQEDDITVLTVARALATVA